MTKLDLAALVAETATPIGRPCGVAAALDAIDTDNRAEFAELIDTLSSAHMARVFARVGQRVHADTIGRHRRGLCRCGQ